MSIAFSAYLFTQWPIYAAQINHLQRHEIFTKNKIWKKKRIFEYNHNYNKCCP